MPRHPSSVIRACGRVGECGGAVWGCLASSDWSAGVVALHMLPLLRGREGRGRWTMLSCERTRTRSMHKHTSAALNAANVDSRPTIAANGHVLHDDGPPKQAASASVNLRHSKSRRLETGGRWRGRRQGLSRCARPHHRRGGQASTVSRSMERRCARPRQQRARLSVFSASARVVLSRRWRGRRQGLGALPHHNVARRRNG